MRQIEKEKFPSALETAREVGETFDLIKATKNRTKLLLMLDKINF